MQYDKWLLKLSSLLNEKTRGKIKNEDAMFLFFARKIKLKCKWQHDHVVMI